ncbi:hypothetical protein BGZ63DRAFT_435526 [Mariannaea sp. PMI_226]|nr:hypothetical protein BGZ63DRAFT_435526 [Mariannaea sp. PMI_226]
MAEKAGTIADQISSSIARLQEISSIARLKETSLQLAMLRTYQLAEKLKLAIKQLDNLIASNCISNEHRLLAMTLRAIASYRQGDLIDAEKRFNQVYDQSEPQSIFRIEAIQGRAYVARARQDFVTAQRLHEQAYEWRKQVLRSNNTETWNSEFRIAVSLLDQGKCEAATVRFAKVHKQRLRYLGFNHPDSQRAFHGKVFATVKELLGPTGKGNFFIATETAGNRVTLKLHVSAISMKKPNAEFGPSTLTIRGAITIRTKTIDSSQPALCLHASTCTITRGRITISDLDEDSIKAVLQSREGLTEIS